MRFNPDYKYQIPTEEMYLAEMTKIESSLSDYKTTGDLRSFDNYRINYAYYLTNNSRASIVILHGFTEFKEKYSELIWYFLHMGFNVFIYDQRDHGHSERISAHPEHTHIDHFMDYVKDLDVFITQVVKPNSDGLPLYIYSHSMGGAVATLYMETHPEEIQKAILSSPMICAATHHVPRQIVRHDIARHLKKGEDLKHPFFAAGHFNPQVSFHPHGEMSEKRFYRHLNLRIHDPLCQSSTSTNGWMTECLRVPDYIFKEHNPRDIKTSVLILNAKLDQVVKKRYQVRLYKQLEHATFHTYETAGHSIYDLSAPALSNYVAELMEFFV